MSHNEKSSAKSAKYSKQISNQDVVFDNSTDMIAIEGRETRLPIRLLPRYDLRWDDLEKLTMPLDRLTAHYAVHLRSENKSDKTIDWYAANLKSFIRWLKGHRYSALLGDMDINTVRLYILYLQDEHVKYKEHPYTPSDGARLSDYSIQGHVRSLRAFSSWLQREGYLQENVLARLKVPKAFKQEIKPLTPEEIGRLLSCLSINTATGSKQYAIICLMLDAGPRTSEVTDLDMPNVDLYQGHLMVRGKGNKQRLIPIGSKAQKYLQRYIYHFRPDPLYPDQDKVFLTSDGRPLTPNALKLMFTRLKQRSSIPRLHAHLLRHTFATYYLRNGGDLLSLQKILGHTSLEMVRVYSHLAESDIRAKHRQFSPMDRLELKSPIQANRRGIKK